MGTATAHVRGRVYHGETLSPVGGVLVALSGVPVPQAEDIWDNGVHARGPDDIHWGEGACTWAFPDDVAPLRIR